MRLTPETKSRVGLAYGGGFEMISESRQSKEESNSFA